MVAGLTNSRWGTRDPYPQRTPMEQRVDMVGFVEQALGGISFRDPQVFDQFRILQALHEAMITTFKDLVSLTYEDIEDLTYHLKIYDQKGNHRETRKKSVPVWQKRSLQAAIAL